jgi:broad specificity phosphatase PhoE
VADPARLSGVDASLALVRHGESTWIVEGRFQGRADPPLSPLGQEQAARVASRLARGDGEAGSPLPDGAPMGVWHSPLARAAMTAQAIGATLGGSVPLHADPALGELAQGDWEGLTLAQVQERYGAQLDAWRRDPTHHHAPGGESIPSGARRVDGVIDELAAALRSSSPSGPSDPVLGYVPAGAAAVAPRPWAIVVAHDGILRLLLMQLLDIPLERYWSFPFALTGISVLELRDGVARLRAHNLVEHLAGLGSSAPGIGLPGPVTSQDPPPDRGGAL